MKRLLSALAASAAIALGAAEAMAQNYRWKMVVISNENSVYTTVFAKPYADKVAELTNGRVQIEVVPSGVIAPPFQEYNAVLDGLADLANVPSIYIYNRDPTNGIPALPVACRRSRCCSGSTRAAATRCGRSIAAPR